MRSLDVVLLTRDSRVAQSLISVLSISSASVHEVQGVSELRQSIAKYRANIAVLDLESASISDVEHLSHEFPNVRIVCTHRLADEEMWTAALGAGAADVCPPTDTRGILRAALINQPANSAAA
jgi:DNA-binding NtrC family response regulator